MKQYLKVSIVIMLFVSVNLFAQTPDTLWTEFYGELHKAEISYCVQQTSDGGYIITGTYSVQAGDIFVIKTDADGGIQWRKNYGGPLNESGECIQQTSDGGYIVVGHTFSFGSGDSDIWLLRMNTDGDTLWTKCFGGSFGEDGKSVAETSDGGYIIAGSTQSFGAGRTDVYLVRTDANGDTLWTRTYGTPERDYGFSVEQTSDGGFVIAGKTGTMEYYRDSIPVEFPEQDNTTRRPSTDHAHGENTSPDREYEDVYLIKTDANGDTLWTRSYERPGSIDRGYSVQQTSDGGYIVAGETGRPGAQAQNFFLVKTNEDGDTLWTGSYGSGYLDERAFSVSQTKDGGYILAGKTGEYITSHVQDVYILKTDADGDSLWSRQYGSSYGDYGYSVKQTFDNGYVIAGYWEYYIPNAILSYGWLIRLTPDSLLTDDSLSLAYNGNRHFVRQPNSVTLHLAYVMEGHILYTKSTDGGDSWGALENLGAGEFPAICLDKEWNPCVTWTRNEKLIYRRKDPIQGWMGRNYYWEMSTPSHPSIAVTPSSVDPYPDTSHILFRLIDNVSSSNEIKEISFPINNPEIYRTRTLDEEPLAGMNTLDFPSVVKDFSNALHAVWMHVDTVWYGTRAVAQADWNVWGWQFDSSGIQSNHPFVEIYGDSIYVVWQRKLDEEIYRGARHIGVTPPTFVWGNFSQTSTTPSLYSVNASGMITTIVDKASGGDEYDIFWDTGSGGSLHNLSNTRRTRSTFPQTSLQITMEPPVQYTIWQEGNDIPYEIKLEKTITGRDSPLISAYFNSIAGFEIPSLYLVERDSFISNWQIPVDIGYDTLKYAFDLVPPYLYKIKIVAYHESPGQLVTRLTLDNTISTLIQYNAWHPETLEMWVPPALYMDSLVEAEFEFISGGLAIGPIYIHRYENITGTRLPGGPQSTDVEPFTSLEQNICTIFKDVVKIDFTLPFDQKTKLCLYDVAGRVIRKMDVSKQVSLTVTNLASGVYFLKIDNPVTGGTICWKFLKVK
jgi:hypothetical protein